LLASTFGAGFAPRPVVQEETGSQTERERLLGRRIADLGLSLRGTVVERLTEQLYAELDAKGLRFHPPVYLSDEWGCPEGTPLIGVPFYLADPALSKIEEDFALGLEDERDIMRFLRHEAGHAYNYAYRLHERPDWQRLFGPYSRPYRERFPANPFSHEYVRHILGWYAQKHPDEDFAETFAVWLTPDSDWRDMYRGWAALAKLEYVDALMRDIGDEPPVAPAPTDEDVPVEAMTFTVADHYRGMEESLPIPDERLFDGDLGVLFAPVGRDDELGPKSSSAGAFIRQHRRELVARITYWTGEGPAVVRQLVDFLATRADALGLTATGREASTLIELTAFGTAVVMNYRYTTSLARKRRRRE
jgi:hypothetical protein